MMPIYHISKKLPIHIGTVILAHKSHCATTLECECLEAEFQIYNTFGLVYDGRKFSLQRKKTAP